MRYETLFVLGLWLFVPTQAAAAPAVQAILGRQEAWTGQGVPLVVTLYSPGPFSGSSGSFPR